MTNVGGTIEEHDKCTKYGFDILIISGSYGGHRQHTMGDRQWTTPGLWHKLPTGELEKITWLAPPVLWDLSLSQPVGQIT